MAFPDTVKCPISFIIKYVIECFFPIFYNEKLVSLLFYENFFGSSWFGLPVPQFYSAYSTVLTVGAAPWVRQS